MNNAAANTLTIPANALVAYPIGTQILVTQMGAGTTSIAITPDTLNSAGASKDGATPSSVGTFDFGDSGDSSVWASQTVVVLPSS